MTMDSDTATKLITGILAGIGSIVASVVAWLHYKRERQIAIFIETDASNPTQPVYKITVSNAGTQPILIIKASLALHLRKPATGDEELYSHGRTIGGFKGKLDPGQAEMFQSAGARVKPHRWFIVTLGTGKQFRRRLRKDGGVLVWRARYFILWTGLLAVAAYCLCQPPCGRVGSVGRLFLPDAFQRVLGGQESCRADFQSLGVRNEKIDTVWDGFKIHSQEKGSGAVSVPRPALFLADDPYCISELKADLRKNNSRVKLAPESNWPVLFHTRVILAMSSSHAGDFQDVRDRMQLEDPLHHHFWDTLRRVCDKGWPGNPDPRHSNCELQMANPENAYSSFAAMLLMYNEYSSNRAGAVGGTWTYRDFDEFLAPMEAVAQFSDNEDSCLTKNQIQGGDFPDDGILIGYETDVFAYLHDHDRADLEIVYPSPTIDVGLCAAALDAPNRHEYARLGTEYIKDILQSEPVWKAAVGVGFRYEPSSGEIEEPNYLKNAKFNKDIQGLKIVELSDGDDPGLPFEHRMRCWQSDHALNATTALLRDLPWQWSKPPPVETSSGPRNPTK